MQNRNYATPTFASCFLLAAQSEQQIACPLPFKSQTAKILSRLPKSIYSYCSIIIIINSIQPLGQFGQEPEPSQATCIALVRCILGKFLGVFCHCFPPLQHMIIKQFHTPLFQGQSFVLTYIQGIWYLYLCLQKALWCCFQDGKFFSCSSMQYRNSDTQPALSICFSLTFLPSFRMWPYSVP